MIVKQTSPKLEYLIKEANTHYGEASRFVKAIYDLALADGWTPKEALQLLISRITVVSKTTIYNCLPDESKNPNFQALGKFKSKSVPHVEQNQPANTINQTIPPIEQPIIEVESETLSTKEDVEGHFEKQKNNMNRFVLLPFTKGMIEFLHLVDMDDIGLKIYVDENLKYNNKLETMADKKS